MKILSKLIARTTLTLSVAFAALPTIAEAELTEASVRSLFESYIEVYNRRFEERTGDAEFKAQILEYLHIPLVMFPAENAPRVITESETAAANFASFTNMLMRKGVRRLEWKDLQVRVLSPSKAIANNLGHGTDSEGQLLYETVSVYLVHKSDQGLAIQTFSPYRVDQRFVIEQP